MRLPVLAIVLMWPLVGMSVAPDLDLRGFKPGMAISDCPEGAIRSAGQLPDEFVCNLALDSFGGLPARKMSLIVVADRLAQIGVAMQSASDSAALLEALIAKFGAPRLAVRVPRVYEWSDSAGNSMLFSHAGGEVVLYSDALEAARRKRRAEQARSKL